MMGPRWKSKHKTGLILASLLGALYLSAVIIAARIGPPHPEPNQLDARHPHFVSNLRPMKHLPHPNPWLIRATGWVVSMVSQLS